MGPPDVKENLFYMPLHWLQLSNIQALIYLTFDFKKMIIFPSVITDSFNNTHDMVKYSSWFKALSSILVSKM